MERRALQVVGGGDGRLVGSEELPADVSGQTVNSAVAFPARNELPGLIKDAGSRPPKLKDKVPPSRCDRQPHPVWLLRGDEEQSQGQVPEAEREETASAVTEPRRAKR